jgi:hypothetical protein
MLVFYFSVHHFSVATDPDSAKNGRKSSRDNKNSIVSRTKPFFVRRRSITLCGFPKSSPMDGLMRETREAFTNAVRIS